MRPPIHCPTPKCLALYPQGLNSIIYDALITPKCQALYPHKVPGTLSTGVKVYYLRRSEPQSAWHFILPTPGMQVFIDLVKYAPDPACSFQYTPGSMNLLETVRLKGAELFLSKKTYISPGKLGTKTRSSVIDETKKYIKKP